MFCLFHIAMATQGHLSGFQVVHSAEFSVRLEGKHCLELGQHVLGELLPGCLNSLC